VKRLRGFEGDHRKSIGALAWGSVCEERQAVGDQEGIRFIRFTVEAGLDRRGLSVGANGR
jgi:hypothetical protein